MKKANKAELVGGIKVLREFILWQAHQIAISKANAKWYQEECERLKPETEKLTQKAIEAMVGLS